MPVDANLQQKVVTLVGMNGISSALKIAVRENFYKLKLKELELEKADEQFRVQHNKNIKELEDTINQFSLELDNIVKKQLREKQELQKVMDVAQEHTEEYIDTQEIITPKQTLQVNEGIKVRMQENVEDDSEELTDDEVPIELSDVDE